jgi:transglutaminase-like putative cysteine protease
VSRYRIVHKTAFRYSDIVGASYNEARMLPSLGDNQMVLSEKLEVEPKSSFHEYIDYFGTRVVMFEVLEPHGELSIVSKSVVQTNDHQAVVPTLNWAELPSAIETSVTLTEAISQTNRTKPAKDLLTAISRLTKGLNPHEAALAVCRFVNQSMVYKFGITGVNSVAKDAWKEKVGVCQDYSHIVLGALRHLGLPARYVSGYLDPGKETAVGQKVLGETHAWVEWWAGSWFAYDPTNDCEVLSRHIFVGRGRDYDDVPPMRGVFSGGSQHSELVVEVQFTREA